MNRAARRLIWLQAAVIVAAAWWVYAPAIHGDWLWDDLQETTGNAVLRDPAGLWKIWIAPAGFDYFPLKTTVQWVQWHVWGDNAAADHVTSIGLHVLSAFLIWHLLRKLGVRLAWLGGLIFAIHPLAVESVAWNAELKNTLSLPLMLLAMIAFVAYDERKYEVRSTKYEGKPPASYFVLLTSYFLFLAAMLCKSSVVMFPVVILLYCWWKRGRIARADVLASLPFFAVSLVLGLVTVWFQQHRAIAGTEVALGGFLPRLAAAGLALAFYLEKCAIPAGFLPIYPRWNVDPPSPLQFLPWIALGGIIWWLWTKRKGWGRHALFGLGFFLANLIPVLGFIPMFYLRLSWVADHFAYLPLVGVVGLAAAGISYASTKYEGRRTKSEPHASHFILLTSYFVFSFLLAALAVESHSYAGIFKNEETLWTYTLERNPGAWMARNNLGNILFQEGRPAAAIEQFRAALQLEPDYAVAHNNMGNVLVAEGRVPEGIEQYRMALKILPDYPDARRNLGLAFLKAGNLPEAAAQFQEAVRLKPDHPEAQANLGDALLKLGRLPEAIAHYEEALRLEPDLPGIRGNLGLALAGAGRLPEAIAQYEQELRKKPDDSEVEYDLGNALTQIGREPEAIAHYERAVRLKPAFPEARANLGNALFKAGRFSEAVSEYEEAVRLKPDYADARYNLGLALRALGRTRDAQAQFDEAARLQASH